MSKLRSARLDGEFRRALGEILHSDIKDPRFSHMAGVSRVETTPDLKFAKVYISVYDDDERRKSTLEALKAASGFIRAKLSEKLSVRRIPELTFILDESIEYSVYMSDLINKVSKKDLDKAKESGRDKVGSDEEDEFDE